MSDWSDKMYRPLMLWSMVVEMALIAVLVLIDGFNLYLTYRIFKGR